MDGPRALNPPVGHNRCDRCGTPAGGLPPVSTQLFRDAALRRCDHCARRSLERDGVVVPVSTCPGCGVAHVEADPDATVCVECRGRRPTVGPSGGALARAAEHELRAALPASLRLVELPSRSEYLCRLARAVAAAISGAPRPAAVAVFEDTARRTLALPSGAVLVSTGCLRDLEDEAELAFVLAHELAHVVAGDAARGLAGTGLRSLAASVEPDLGRAAWTRAAEDLMALGHGLEHERAADRTALEALLQLGYDPASPSAWLERLQIAVDAGDADVAELACAHPPAWDRRQRVGEHLGRRSPAAGPGRTNREVFRRAAGPAVLSQGLRPLEGGLVDPEAPSPNGPGGRAGRVALWTTLGIALLAGLFLVLGYLFGR